MNRRHLKLLVKAEPSLQVKELSAFYKDNCQSKNALKASKSPQIKVKLNDKHRPNSVTGTIQIAGKGKDQPNKNVEYFEVNKQNQPPQVSINIREQPKMNDKCRKIQNQGVCQMLQNTYKESFNNQNLFLNNRHKNAKILQTRKKDIYLFNQHQLNKSKSPSNKNKSSNPKVARKSNSSEKQIFTPVLQRRDLDKCQIHIDRSGQSRQEQQQNEYIFNDLTMSPRRQIPQAKYYIDTRPYDFICCQECFMRIKNNLSNNTKVSQIPPKQRSLGTHNSLNSRNFRTVHIGQDEDRSEKALNQGEFAKVVKQIQKFDRYRKNLENYQNFFAQNLKKSHNIHSEYYKILKQIISQAQKKTELELSRFTNQCEGRIQNIFIQIDKNISILKSASNRIMCMSAEKSGSENISNRIAQTRKQINAICKNVLAKVKSNIVASNQECGQFAENTNKDSLQMDFNCINFDVQEFKQQISKFQQLFKTNFQIKIIHNQELSISLQSKHQSPEKGNNANAEQSLNNTDTIINNLSVNKSFIDSVQQSLNQTQIFNIQSSFQDLKESYKQQNTLKKFPLRSQTAAQTYNQKRNSNSDIGTMDLFCDQQIQKRSQSQASNQKKKINKYQKNFCANLGGSLNYYPGIGPIAAGRAMYFSFQRNPEASQLHQYVIMETNQQDSATTSPVFKQI